MKILVFGEILWDIIEGYEHLGGAPLNFAAHISQLGIEASIISSVGRDRLGTKALQELSKLSLDTRFVQVSANAPTGTVRVKLDEGQPQYEIIEDVAYDHINYDRIDSSLLNDCDVVYFGTLAQRNRESRETLSQILSQISFKHIFCDLNLRKACYTAETVISSIDHCTILKLNDDEVATISKLVFNSIALDLSRFWKLIKERFSAVEILIVTLGKNGCSIFSDNTELHISTEPCEVKDTIGAGDAFSAAFLHSYLKCNDLQISGQKANKLGAFVAANEGAIPKMDDELLNEFKSEEQ